MEHEQLEFITFSPYWSDYLVLEAWISDKQVAQLYHEDGIWKVDFYPQDKEYVTISWETYIQIHQRFIEFIEEEKKHPPM